MASASLWAGWTSRPASTPAPGSSPLLSPRPGTRLELSVITSDDDAVAVAYADPQGGTRAVRHAALARIELNVHRQGNHELTLSSSRAAYEYGSRQGLPGIELQPLPEN